MSSNWTFAGCVKQGLLAENTIAAQAAVPVKVADNRYLTVYALLDMRGHDSCCGVVGELRENSPLGTVKQRLTIAAGGNECRFFDDDEELYYRCAGQAQVFGSMSVNVWVVKYYVYAHKFQNGVLNNPGSPKWSGRPHAAADSLRLYTVQLTYDAAEDCIKIIEPETKMLTDCAVYNSCSANHALTPPVALNSDKTEFAELVTFTPRGEGLHGTGSHGKVAPVIWKFDPAVQRYRVHHAGEWWQIDDFIGEASVVKTQQGDFIASLRSFGRSGEIVLCRTEDLFKGFGRMVRHKGSCTPRTLYCSSDGVLRLFTNIDWMSPYKHDRNPLYEFTIDKDLNLSASTTVFDAATLPMKEPFADMAKYFELSPGHEMLFCRVIDLVQTVGNMNLPPPSKEGVNVSGIYAFERKK